MGRYYMEEGGSTIWDVRGYMWTYRSESWRTSGIATMKLLADEYYVPDLCVLLMGATVE